MATRGGSRCRGAGAANGAGGCVRGAGEPRRRAEQLENAGGGKLQRQQRLWGRSLFPEELASGFVATSGLRPMLFQVSVSRTSVARSELEEVFLGRDEAGSSGQLLGAAGQRGAEPGAARPQQSGRREEGSWEAAPGGAGARWRPREHGAGCGTSCSSAPCGAPGAPRLLVEGGAVAGGHGVVWVRPVAAASSTERAPAAVRAAGLRGEEAKCGFRV